MPLGERGTWLAYVRTGTPSAVTIIGVARLERPQVDALHVAAVGNNIVVAHLEQLAATQAARARNRTAGCSVKGVRRAVRACTYQGFGIEFAQAVGDDRGPYSEVTTASLDFEQEDAGGPTQPGSSVRIEFISAISGRR